MMTDQNVLDEILIFYFCQIKYFYCFYRLLIYYKFEFIFVTYIIFKYTWIIQVGLFIDYQPFKKKLSFILLPVLTIIMFSRYNYISCFRL